MRLTFQNTAAFWAFSYYTKALPPQLPRDSRYEQARAYAIEDLKHYTSLHRKEGVDFPASFNRTYRKVVVTVDNVPDGKRVF